MCVAHLARPQLGLGHPIAWQALCLSHQPGQELPAIDQHGVRRALWRGEDGAWRWRTSSHPNFLRRWATLPPWHAESDRRRYLLHGVREAVRELLLVPTQVLVGRLRGRKAFILFQSGQYRDHWRDHRLWAGPSAVQWLQSDWLDWGFGRFGRLHLHHWLSVHALQGQCVEGKLRHALDRPVWVQVTPRPNRRVCAVA